VNRGAPASPQPKCLQALRVYLALSLVLNLLWETLHLPLYTIWTTGSVREKAFAVVHCAIGDVMIAGLALVAALAVAGSNGWPIHRARKVFAITLMIGIAYTIYSEWLNTTARQRWAYSPLMPVHPMTGTGLSPFLQWLAVPPIALSLATQWHHRSP
jgi:phosphatidylglycerophosphate synthase